MHLLLFSAPVTVSPQPKVVFFASRKKVHGKAAWENVTGQVVRLELGPVDASAETQHVLRRVDAQGQTVWQTRHPSLQEAFWHAEWEYDLPPEDWTPA